MDESVIGTVIPSFDGAEGRLDEAWAALGGQDVPQDQFYRRLARRPTIEVLDKAM
jgi:hypothetical protein